MSDGPWVGWYGYGMSTSMILLSDRLRKSHNETGTVKGGFSLCSRRTMRGPPKNLLLRNSELKRQSSVEGYLSSTLMRGKLVFTYFPNVVKR